MMNDDNYRYEYQEIIDPNDEDVLLKGIDSDAFLKKQMDLSKPFGIFIKNDANDVCAGVTGYNYYGCLHIDMLFVKEDLRNLGYGKKLMMEAEKIGRTRHCLFATVNTMDFEALVFYQKLGYEIEFTRAGYQNKSTMYMLRKAL